MNSDFQFRDEGAMQIEMTTGARRSARETRPTWLWRTCVVMALLGSGRVAIAEEPALVP